MLQWLWICPADPAGFGRCNAAATGIFLHFTRSQVVESASTVHPSALRAKCWLRLSREIAKGKWHEHQKSHCFKENETGQGFKKKSLSLTSTEPITITIIVIIDSLLQLSKNPLPGMGHHYTIDTNSQQDFTTASTVAQSPWHHLSHGWDVHPCSILYHILTIFHRSCWEKAAHCSAQTPHGSRHKKSWAELLSCPSILCSATSCAIGNQKMAVPRKCMEISCILQQSFCITRKRISAHAPVSIFFLTN